jgi:Helix-turn-helix domain
MDPVQSPDDLLLIDEVAIVTRRTVDTLRWLRHRGEGPPAHRAGRRIYFRRGGVMRWLAEQEQAGRDPRSGAA